MSFWKIAWRNLQQRALASSLTGLSMALGVALMIVVIVIHAVGVRQFSQDAQGYHLIVGPKGGKMQLVLNTVYHLSQPIENVHWYYYKEFVQPKGRFRKYTRTAIPYCLGDSYTTESQRFRIVGTIPELFDELSYGNGKDYAFREGRNFRREGYFEAVIGSVVAYHTGLAVGDTFHASHGIGGETSDLHDDEAFEIVGILEPTGTANDRALFVNLEGFFLLGDGQHALSEEQVQKRLRELAADRGTTVEVMEAELAGNLPQPEAEATESGEQEGEHHAREPLSERRREVTSILVLAEDDTGGLIAAQLENIINEGPSAQAVSPISEVESLMQNIVGWVHLVLLVMSILIVVVAGISILVSIYNSMSERSHDIAVMRALGASRTAVMAIILTESILLSLCGGLLGIALGHGLIGLAAPYVEARTGVALGVFQFDKAELILVPALVVLASIVGFLPALAAYRTDVAKSLAGSR
jgi:putative ABC transport system permease protein